MIIYLQTNSLVFIIDELEMNLILQKKIVLKEIYLKEMNKIIFYLIMTLKDQILIITLKDQILIITLKDQILIITLKDQILIITRIDQMQQMIYFILKMINITSDSVDQVNILSKGKFIVNMYKIKLIIKLKNRHK